MTVVGSGLLANLFLDKKIDKNVLIFASGVSNSLETDKNEFAREFALLRHHIQMNGEAKLIYFSTCSIDSGIETPYVNHKLKVEAFVKANCDRFYIFRLPQVVGYSGNNTLINYFYKRIVNGEAFSVEKNAKRNLLFDKDLCEVVNIFINNHRFEGNIINIASKHNVSVVKLVDYMYKRLKITPQYSLIEAGYSHEINIELLAKILPVNHKLLSRKYWKNAVDRYIDLRQLEISNEDTY